MRDSRHGQQISQQSCRPMCKQRQIKRAEHEFGAFPHQGSFLINGGSISIGHPFGMTGSRLVGTLANEMLRRKAKLGEAPICIGGGQGAAGLFEACN